MPSAPRSSAERRDSMHAASGGLSVPMLPRGTQLDDDAFAARMQVVTAGLLIAIVVVGIVGALSDASILHSLAEMTPVIGCLVIAHRSGDRAIATGAVSVGLAVAAAMLVHFTDGLLESHFAFFVVLPLIALLHDWRAVLGASLIVFLHHAVLGSVWPGEVYDHPAAQDRPVLWGLIHVAFVLALVAVLFAHWRHSQWQQLAIRCALDDAHRSEAALRHRATHDSLTGLPNRNAVVEHLTEMLRPGGCRVGVLCLDVDRFTDVNHSMGHAAGDALLVSVARALVDGADSGHTVARLGGSEFVVLVGDPTSFDQLVEVGERIHDRLRAPIRVRDTHLAVSTSIGVAMAEPGDAVSVLLRNADVATYQAKQSGRGAIAVFDERARAEREQRLELESELRRADFDHEMALHYQPLFDATSGDMYGVEALVRWHHPDRGLVMPGDFIAAAEDSGLIVPLGEWVLEEACRQAAAWHREFGVDLTMSVNVSGRQLGHPGFAGLVSDVLDETGVAPEKVVIEMTESALFDDASVATANLRAIRDLGVRASLDDYGTGYAALTYLNTLPLSSIKIDRSFITGIETSERAAAIVESTVSLAHSLDLLVVAEGIEDAAQLPILRRIGCDFAQGYHLGRPMDPLDLEASILRRAPRVVVSELPAHAVTS